MNRNTGPTPLGPMNTEKLRIAIEAMENAQPLMRRLAEVTAKQKKASFDAYASAGFTRAEALHLVSVEGKK